MFLNNHLKKQKQKQWLWKNSWRVIFFPIQCLLSLCWAPLWLPCPLFFPSLAAMIPSPSSLRLTYWFPQLSKNVWRSHSAVAYVFSEDEIIMPRGSSPSRVHCGTIDAWLHKHPCAFSESTDGENVALHGHYYSVRKITESCPLQQHGWNWSTLWLSQRRHTLTLHP